MNSACLEGGGRDVRFARGPSNRAASSAVLGSGSSSSVPESTSKPVGRETTTSAFLCRRHSWPVESLCGAGGEGNEETAEMGVSGGSIGQGFLRRLRVKKVKDVLRRFGGRGGSTHQPVPSPEPDGFLDHAREPDEGTFRAIVPRHADLEWSGTSRRGEEAGSVAGGEMIYLDDGFFKSAQPPNVFGRAVRVVLVDPSRGRFEGGRPRGGRGQMRGAARRVDFRYDSIDAD